MINLIASYINCLTPADVEAFALKNDINLSPAELEFTYNFVKNNYNEVLSNPQDFDFSKYAGVYSPENYQKVDVLIKKYANYL